MRSTNIKVYHWTQKITVHNKVEYGPNSVKFYLIYFLTLAIKLEYCEIRKIMFLLCNGLA